MDLSSGHSSQREDEILRKIGELTVERDCLFTRARSRSLPKRRAMIEPEAELSIRRQCELLAVSRSGWYYEPMANSHEELALMRRIGELHLEHAFLGSRKLCQQLRKEGRVVNRKRVQRLMQIMGRSPSLLNRHRPASPRPSTRATHTCCEGSRSHGSTRSGPRT